ncbi:BolA family transcriptional regulator [Ponticoccus sp. SC2-23]|uniref:BolA family protein n=1 Tax=Alexandriicola marinus TaxID=2081710 RepID=UPI000FD9A97A|nr:BolA family protein [Alexandriicola marinus]MBM1219459.1 BolA family transcriptional regulator [Ponticoccus sp. SC6-9]MBM1223469.1 BolA family transcriptional regulator [Ponticoccus sp. SC6-15]MBM1229272.1 BolA family transcriptional regulator [Ponticoccus sp. SC6-38]MBM1232435.1 BolA family transcriptional regulator [Ponticoccus sp. SC6-45]MBM1237615.1 BolA family transcriptional regulator [Ponticoccus sp. SC6-49]MBM1241446.1 BolA family transcriptional regulator [Ponticoccus sp. SC2-64]
MTLEAEIRDALTGAFAPTSLEVINESHQHAGHAGDDGSGESHWRVVIRSDAFEGQSRIARHRAVHAALGEGIMGRLHALALDIGT